MNPPPLRCGTAILTIVAPHTTPAGEPGQEIDSPSAPSPQPSSPQPQASDHQVPPAPSGAPRPAHDQKPKDKPVSARDGAARLVANKIMARINSGVWAGDNYPTIHEIKDALHCSLHNACDATKILAAEGVIHKVKLARAQGQRGRLLVWRPVEVAPDGPEEAARQVEDDIRSGRLVGPLPMIGEMAQDLHVSNKVISTVYHRLRDEGLIDQVWMDDARYRVWYAFHGPNDPARQRTGECKSLAIAHDLIQRMPEWLVRRPRGAWCRTPLPDMESLRIHYSTHFFTIEAALNLLVRLHILEQPLGSNRIYLPRPPADDGASHNVQFATTAAALGRDWFPAPKKAHWLPLSRSRDDEIFAGLGNRASQARREYLQNRQQRLDVMRRRGLL